jgi:hypothetical protein
MVFMDKSMPLIQIFNELKKTIPFKDTTTEGDIILVGMKQGLSYGLILEINPNVKREWWDVQFKLLVIPPVNLNWILRTTQMCGEIFTMNGEDHFMIAVEMEIPQKPLQKIGGRAALSIVRKSKEEREK